MKLPLPANLADSISQRAAQLARESIQSMGWSEKSINAVQPMNGDGKVGIHTTQKYILAQSRGFKPFLMTWVEGRVVPLHDKASGQTHFRYGKEVGQPGWVTLPGGVRVYREQKWRHPGLKPKNFLENAIQQAINEAKPKIQQQLRATLIQGQ